MLNIPRLHWSLVFITLGTFFTLLYAVEGASAWRFCYAFALFSAGFYLWKFRGNFFSLASIFVALSFIAISFPVVPYLFFDLGYNQYFFDSIYINSLGIFFFLAVSFLKSPTRIPKASASQFLISPAWKRFYRINSKICLISFPFVLWAITLAGAWGAFFNLENSGYDRVASMKGMGTLMIFSVINITSAFFWAQGLWVRGKKIRAVILLAFFVFINGFTNGRGNLIFVFFAALLFYMVVRGMNRKILIGAFFGGLLIILMKLTRGYAGVSDYPWMLQFFLHFAGDFDSLNNGTALIEYTRQHGFFGLYHIWSNILIYIPRELYPNKPHDIGGLYLNTYLFPGVYRGAEGGTGLSLGFQGIWYAVAGLPSLIFGNLVLGWSLSLFDRLFARYVAIGEPKAFLIAYIMLIGQSVIIYRDGFYAFLNVAFYMCIYWMFVKFFLRGRNAAFVSSRVMEKS